MGRPIKIMPSDRLLYKAIKEYIAQNGFSPTIRELQLITDTSSTSVILSRMDKLMVFGYITFRERMARTILILKEMEDE